MNKLLTYSLIHLCINNGAVYTLEPSDNILEGPQWATY